MRGWLWLVLLFVLPRSVLTMRGNLPTGGLCGSVFLDRAFQKHIEETIGETEYRSLRARNRKKMMRDFEYGIKRCFREHDDQTYYVDLRGVKDDPKNGIFDDTITLKTYAPSG